MIITPVDDKKDLFLVENIYPQNLLEKLKCTDHLSVESKKEDWQDHWPRRKLILEEQSIYEQMHLYVQKELSTIEKLVNTDFLACDTGFWLDLPGFDMESHLDNDGVYAAMQIYLTENTKPMPTIFYNSDDSVRFEPKYRINFGYLMLNNKNQWHAMPYTVPKNEYRLTSYTWFYKK